MKESRALKLGFNKVETDKYLKFGLQKQDLFFCFTKCKFSGNNLSYKIFNDIEIAWICIGSKETFEYLLTVEDAWEKAKVLNK